MTPTLLWTLSPRDPKYKVFAMKELRTVRVLHLTFLDAIYRYSRTCRQAAHGCCTHIESRPWHFATELWCLNIAQAPRTAGWSYSPAHVKRQGRDTRNNQYPVSSSLLYATCTSFVFYIKINSLLMGTLYISDH